MRVITTLLLFSFLSISSKAQYSKGTKLVGGSLSISSYKHYNEAAGSNLQTSFSVRPSAGVFYQKNRLAGANLHFGLSTYDDLPNGHTFGGGVFLRQYVQLGKSAFSFFGHESADIIIGRSSRYQADGSNPYRSKSTDVSVAVAPAFAYAPTKRLQVEVRLPNLLSLGYSRQKPVVPIPGAYNYSQLNFFTGFENSSFGVGASLLF